MKENASLIEMIEEKLKTDEIGLPIPKDVALNLSILLGKEDIEVRETSRLIEKDPSLTAKILNLSNSPVYSGLVKIKSIEQAIARLGAKTVKNFLMTIKFKDVFMSRDNFMEKRFKINWQHSLACALCAKKIAESSNLAFISEDAYLLGLMHDIGVIPILGSIAEVRKEKSHIEFNDELIEEIIMTFHPWAGKQILHKLNFDEKIEDITETHHTPEKYQDQDDPLFCILQVAENIVNKIGISMTPDPNISILGLPYTSKLGLDPMFISVTEVDLEDMLSDTDRLL